ncbi:leucyl-tRNA synthetase [Diplocarpon rosae]|nr:leucyl-tRNA synthetase [Diplocarpon rosae]
MHSSIGRHTGRGLLSRRHPRSWGGNRRILWTIQARSKSSSNSTLDLPYLDKKWQKIWQLDRATDLQKRRDNDKLKPKTKSSEKTGRYVLPMFPYPSGDLHLGHLRVYTISDVLARFQRMQGHEVIHPIGWDAFGLPAENAAIERGIDPATWTRQNVDKMRRQLQAMNGHWDWEREFATCDPSFYKHTQQLFLMLHGAGLAYQAESLVNYDPVDKTVLANEQVDCNGHTIFGVQYIALASTHPMVQALAKTDVELQSFLDTIPTLPPNSKMGYLLPHIRALNPLAYEESTSDATKAPLPIYVAPYVLGDYGDGAVMGVPGHDTRDHSFWKHIRDDDPIRVVISQSADEATSELKEEPYLRPGYLNRHAGSLAGLTSSEATKTILSLLARKQLGSAAESWRLRDWLVSRQRYWGTPIPIIHCAGCGPVPVPDDQLPVELPPVEDHWADGKTHNPLEHAHDWINTTCPRCGSAAKRDTDTMDTFVDSSWYFMRFPDPSNGESLFSPESANQNLPVDLYVGGVEHAILHLLYARFISKFIATTPLWPEGTKRLGGEPFKMVLAQGMVHGKTYLDPETKRFLKPDEVDLTNLSQPLVKATRKVANVSFEKMSKSKYNGVDPSNCMAKYGADATRAHILFQAPVSEVLEWDEGKIAGITRWFHKLHGLIFQNSEVWQSNVWLNDFEPKMYFKSSVPRESYRVEPHESLQRVQDLDQLSPERRNAFKRAHQQLNPDRPLMSFDESRTERHAISGTRVGVKLSWLKSLVGARIAQFTQMLKSGRLPGPLRFHFEPPPLPRAREPAGSVFKQSFPTVDGTFEMLASSKQKCAVQVNGKVRCVVEIEKSGEKVQGKQLEAWIVKQILGTAEGKKRLTGMGQTMDVSKAKKVVVVQGGRTVNFVV